MFIDLLSKVLVYSPRDRIKPLEALIHPYFNELRAETFNIPNVKLPSFFDFTKGICVYLLIKKRGTINLTRDIS
jgi:glycogen synthase kinase 3 beta